MAWRIEKEVVRDEADGGMYDEEVPGRTRTRRRGELRDALEAVGGAPRCNKPDGGRRSRMGHRS
jgi:hypothetical protein